VVTVAAGTEIGFVTTTGTSVENLTFTNPPPVIVLQSSAGVSVLVNTGTGGTQHYVVVGSSGNDTITISGTNGADVALGTGHSTVSGGQGDDTIVGGGGSSTVSGGGGHDVLVLHGVSGDFSYHQATSTVVAGTSGLSPQTSTTDHVIVTNSVTGETVDLTGIQYVQLDNNEAIIVAASTVEAGVASLYHAAFGRDADAGGTAFWFDHANAGMTLQQIAYGFTQSAEWQSTTAHLSDSAFVTQLYQNTFGRDPEAGGLSYWIDKLGHGMTRYDLMAGFATVAALNDAGVIHTEATVVGNVIIVDHIV
jgi:Ca2+-binding RTX toxin-like protein